MVILYRLYFCPANKLTTVGYIIIIGFQTVGYMGIASSVEIDLETTYIDIYYRQ